MTFDFLVEGNTLSGTVSDDMLKTLEIRDGKIEGGSITFSAIASIEDNDLQIDYHGKVTAGQLEMTRKIGQFGTLEGIASRANLRFILAMRGTCGSPEEAEIRKVIYTTNAVESLNMSLRKALKPRMAFPSEEAALKVTYLALRNLIRKWEQVGEWKAALNCFTPLWQDRIRAANRM